MDFSEAVQWWEDWQLRVLALSSLFLQYFLYFAAPLRKRCIPSWFRFIIWLAYLGSDAVAIYALAALFNRHKKQEWVDAHRDDASLEALWAPILLRHLGGVNTITAYNIEDNELWRRHVLTTVSQVAVAIYVFHKSWSGDKRLLQAAILIFIAGILKCIEKPLALKSASISSLMRVKAISRSDRGVQSDEMRSEIVGNDELYCPFVDMAPTFKGGDGDRRHFLLLLTLSLSFDRLYTKEQVSGAQLLVLMHLIDSNYIPWKRIFGYLLRAVVNPLIFAAIGLFHNSHRGAYNSVDVKVTYILLCCTASLEYIRLLWLFARMIFGDSSFVWYYGLVWPDQIAQYNLIGYLASNKKHCILTTVAASLGCEDYLDSFWCMKPFKRSSDITDLVSGYIDTWKNDQSEVATNWAFNDYRGQWTLKKQGCQGSKTLRESLQKPFDESVLLWHLATEFCYFDHVDNTGGDDIKDDQSDDNYSRVISNYMAYLLFINPEMLMTGARPSLFRDEYKRLKGMLLDDGKPQEKTALMKRELGERTIQLLKGGKKGGGIIDCAWALYDELTHVCEGNSDNMWKVIEGVWVEMLCFSASRCRGYLHAKSLGKGGEYLSYIWLLLSYSGIETLAEKMQRVPELGGDNGGTTCAELATQATTAVTGDESGGVRMQDGGQNNGDSPDGITLAAPTLAARVGGQEGSRG